MAALAVVVLWAVLGPLFGFSDTWQLVINTGTTIATFLMVFVIQNSLNRGNKAIQLKLDELIRTSVDARDVLVGAQDLSEREIDRLEAEEEADARREDQDRAPRSSSSALRSSGSPNQHQAMNASSTAATTTATPTP